MPRGNNEVYLTFDDGPHPTITNFILEELRKVNAKATFFCIGKNAAANPQVLHQISKEGHTIGNHTFSHLNGWKSSFEAYKSDVQKCEDVFKSKLFRPPYGRMSLRQFFLIKRNYKVVLWDVLALDYRHELIAEDCINIVMANTRDGSIITFHDSEKAWPRLKIALPIILNQLISQGFSLKAIPDS
jgi:peptidoglycan/xylan/chitin deacetylase (PgdA/CDA1 family)